LAELLCQERASLQIQDISGVYLVTLKDKYAYGQIKTREASVKFLSVTKTESYILYNNIAFYTSNLH